MQRMCTFALREKCPNISGPYFPAFGLNTGKNGPEIPPYLETFHAVLPSLCSSCKVGAVGLLCEEKKQYPVLLEMPIKEYREKAVASCAWNTRENDTEFMENSNNVLILLFMLYLG